MEGVSSHTVKKNHVEWEISLQSFLRKCSLPCVAYEWVTGLGESSSHTFYLVGQCIIYQCITFSDLGVFPFHLRVRKAKVKKKKNVTYPSHGQWQTWDQLADFYLVGLEMCMFNECPR